MNNFSLPHVENWHLPVIEGNLCLQGTVTNHPKIKDGLDVCTFPVVRLDVDNKLCITDKYTYTLGEPNSDFLEFLKEHDRELRDFSLGPPIIN